MNQNNKKNKICKGVAGMLMVTSMISLSANAGATVKGYLNTSVHYIPILKDTARATTTITNPNDFDTAYTKTYVYAYNSSGEMVSDTATAHDTAAVEGLSSGQAEASIRSMVKAKSTHKGKSDQTNNKWLVVYNSWGNIK